MSNLINLFNNKYPYTDYHELNLSWLLETYQEIVDNVNELITWMNTHQTEYEEAMQRLAAVENEIDTFEQQIEERFAQLVAEQQAQLDAALAQMRLDVDTEINKLRTEVEKTLKDITTDFEILQNTINTELANMKVYLNQQIVLMRSMITANNDYIIQYVENRLDDFIAHFPDLVNIPVYNPVRGETTGLQQCLNDLYDLSRFYGLTAWQYDSLGLTASEYDAYELTAIDYDQQGYVLLGYPDENWYMISPFTGQYVKVKDVVYQLCHFHMDTLTATEYDALELDADTYDAKLITAFDYDWFGKDILTA